MMQNDFITELILNEYRLRRSTAENKAFEIRENLEKDKEYSEIHYRIKGLSLDISKADFTGDKKTAEILRAERKNLKDKERAILDKKGLTYEDLSPRYTCDKCKDTAYTEDGKLCDCYYKTLAKITEKFLTINTPEFPCFKNYCTYDKRDEVLKDKLLDYCKKFPDLKKRNLLFTGSAGAGKTFAAGCIAREIKSANYSVIFLSATKLNDIFLRYHISGFGDKKAISDLITTCDLLVIDDLGTEPILTNVTVEYLTSFISERLNEEKPFIITTNLNFDEIKTRYTDRLLSRICCDNTAKIDFKGKDKRFNGKI